jgi:hypothetical protein
MTGNRERGTTSPTGWFFVIVLIWILAYPAYLYKRKQYGATNRVVLGVLLALFFSGSLFAVGYSIEAKKAEIRESLGGLARQFTLPNQSPETNSPPALDGIYAKVASDAINHYSIAKRNGTVIDVCIQAGLVSAAFLQANDEANYKVWKQTQQTDCSNAGMPMENMSSSPVAKEVSNPTKDAKEQYEGLVTSYTPSENTTGKQLKPGDTAADFDEKYQTIIRNEISKYESAKRSGNQQQTCLNARSVAYGYAQARDTISQVILSESELAIRAKYEANYQDWNRTQKVDCFAIGMPANDVTHEQPNF